MSPLYRHDDNPHGAPLSRPVKLLFSLLAIIGMVAAGFSIAIYMGDREQRRSDEIASCRSSFSSELITGPTVAALKAMAVHGSESDEFVAAATAADPERFQMLAVLSRSNPSEFLRLCKASPAA